MSKMPNMKSRVKKALRLKGDTFDLEIVDLIAAAEADLEAVGISIPTRPPRVKSWRGDPLIIRAINLYCKANFGYIEGGERFKEAYDLLKNQLRMMGGYRNAVE